MGRSILYLTTLDLRKKTGIANKVNAQIEAFEHHCFSVFTTDVSDCVTVRDAQKIILRICLRKLPFRALSVCAPFYKIFKSFILPRKIDVLYVRHFPLATLLIFIFKLQAPKLKVFMEIPTYPYLQETKSFFRKLLNCLPYLFERAVTYRYIDRIVTFSAHRLIAGVKTIHTGNGYGCNVIEIVRKPHENIIFTSVSSLSFWHGVDRFLFSLAAYRLPGILFNIVGIGAEQEKLKKIVEKDSYLQQIVSFKGFLSGDELTKIYETTDICVGSLGIHRLNLSSVNTLKNREYLVMGFPILYSSVDPLLSEKLPFVFHVSNDEKEIDINSVIVWYKNLKVKSEEISIFAQNNLSWNKQLKPVVDEINELLKGEQSN